MYLNLIISHGEFNLFTQVSQMPQLTNIVHSQAFGLEYYHNEAIIAFSGSHPHTNTKINKDNYDNYVWKLIKTASNAIPIPLGTWAHSMAVKYLAGMTTHYFIPVSGLDYSQLSTHLSSLFSDAYVTSKMHLMNPGNLAHDWIAITCPFGNFSKVNAILSNCADLSINPIVVVPPIYR